MRLPTTSGAATKCFPGGRRWIYCAHATTPTFSYTDRFGGWHMFNSLLQARSGEWYFNLKAGNGQVIGTSQMYADQGGRTTGIESEKANGPSTDVREV